MTVSKTTSSATFFGNGSATAFSLGFYVAPTDTLQLYTVAENGELTTVLSGFSFVGDKLAETTALTFSVAPDSGTEFYAVRETPPSQLVSLAGQVSYNPTVVEGVWDKLTRLMQELQTGTGKVLRATTTLAPIKLMAGQMLMVNADGTGVICVPSTDTAGLLYAMGDREAFVAFVASGALDYLTDGVTVMAGGLGYIREVGATVISDLPGYVPSGDLTPQHMGAVGDGVSDDTVAYQAALNAGAGKLVLGVPGATYKVTAELSLKSGTTWDHNGSEIVAHGAASSSFFSIWKPENGANGFRVLGQDLDCNDIPGMVGFILRTGSHDGVVDGFRVRNFLHQKNGVDGGRGFVVESLDTVLPNGNLIITNGVCSNGYMGFAVQSGSAFGERSNLIINNIAVEDCNVVFWVVGQGTGYPYEPAQMQGIISNVTARNCGLVGPYANGGGAFAGDRACNFNFSNVVLANDADYGLIPSVWHGNGARINADITFHGSCTNFWDLRPYKEADSNPIAENTIQDSKLRGRLHGSCTDIAFIGSATTTFVQRVYVEGDYDTVTSDTAVSPNLRANGTVQFDVRSSSQNCRLSGSALAISAATFSAYAGKTRKFSTDIAGASRSYILSSIPDDSVATLVIPAMLAGMISISPSGIALPCGMLAIRSVATVFSRVVWQAAGTTSSITIDGVNGTVLSGTTGTDGHVTVSCVGTTLYVENRSGMAATYVVTIHGLT